MSEFYGYEETMLRVCVHDDPETGMPCTEEAQEDEFFCAWHLDCDSDEYYS